MNDERATDRSVRALDSIRRHVQVAAWAIMPLLTPFVGCVTPEDTVASGTDARTDAGLAEDATFLDGDDTSRTSWTCAERDETGRCVCARVGETRGAEIQPRNFCCDPVSHAPTVCVLSRDDFETYFWQDMTEFGFACGGRDFPWSSALPACPWDEESP